MTDLQHVSLFSGIGGFDLACEHVGIPTVAAVEIDPAARGVLRNRFPQTQLFNDVTKVTADDLRNAGAVPGRTVLTGGFPCQPFSVAGHRRGMGGGDARGNLYCRGREGGTTAELGNVPGLLSIDGGRTMGTILRDLGQRGYGYAYRVLDAQHFGVPQRRRRVFFVGHLGGAAGPAEILLEPESGSGGAAAQRTTRPGTTGRVGGGAATGRVAHTLTSEGADASEDGTGRGVPLVISALTANGVGTCGADDNQAQAGHLITYQKVIRSGARNNAGELGNEQAFAPRASRSPYVLTERSVRRLTPLECERLQGFPDGWTRWSNDGTGRVEQADSPRYRQLGNAVCVNVVEWIARRLVNVSKEQT